MRKLLLLLLLLSVPSLASAANITTSTCPGAGCVDYVVTNHSGIGIQITGTFSGTITFQASIDGATFVAFNVTPAASGTDVSTTTGTGLWTKQLNGITIIRVVFTSFSSGTAVVTVTTLK